MLKCKICGKKFLITSNYEVHLKVFHEPKPISIDTFVQNGDSKEGIVILDTENSSLCSAVKELQELKNEVTNKLDTPDFAFCPVKVEKDVSMEDGLVTCKSEPIEDTDFDVTFGKSASSCSGPSADSDGTIPYCDESTKSQIQTEVLPLESPRQRTKKARAVAVKNHPCSKCSIQFTSARSAYYHWTKHHSHDSTDWPWTCLKCGRRSTSRGTFRSHMITHRRVVVLKRERLCLICGDSTRSRTKVSSAFHDF